MEKNLKQAAVNPGNPISRIAIYGPESTGKTTLARQLAEHFKTVWAPEFARDYLQQKWDSSQTICEPSDLLPIAKGQINIENEQFAKANEYLFADTCALATKVFADMYYGTCDPIIEKAAKKHKYDLFLLTDIDVPWEKDDLRDRPSNRKDTFETFKKALVKHNKPFVVLSGNQNERFETAITVLRKLERAHEMGFSSLDFMQIYNHGLDLETIGSHLQIYNSDLARTIIDRPALTDDGILKFTDAEFEQRVAFFDSEKPKFSLQKFVPASGAASRMFKFLTEFLNEFDPESETVNAYINRKKATELTVFVAGIEKFPFFDAIKETILAQHPDFIKWEGNKKKYYFIKLLLDEGPFNYSNKPKGVLPFHKYSDHVATPVEEHVNESYNYASSSNLAKLHFTVSDSHKAQFEDEIEIARRFLYNSDDIDLDVSFSYQNIATDTIAVDMQNLPFRDKEGRLVFRPGGHGALLQNLNNLDADIIFIKNIDNVIQDHIETISFYKKALGGILIRLQRQIFEYLKKISTDEITEADIPEIVEFMQKQLFISLHADFLKFTIEYKLKHLADLLNRPLRICGMVKNESETGGGPFWVRDKNNNVSLQIVETGQINLNNDQQAKVFSKSTHFNPVDVVCGIRDFEGNKFNLDKFVDHNTGFIVHKNKKGKDLKAYELPGLWNGAMANWISVFVEVPLITFNPVKTVNDLLKPAHQPQ